MASLIPVVCCTVTNYLPTLGMHCRQCCSHVKYRRVASVPSHRRDGSLPPRPSSSPHRLTSSSSTSTSSSPISLPPCLSGTGLVSLGGGVCRYSWCASRLAARRRPQCPREQLWTPTRTYTEKPQQESRLIGLLFILSSAGCLCLITASIFVTINSYICA